MIAFPYFKLCKIFRWAQTLILSFPSPLLQVSLSLRLSGLSSLLSVLAMLIYLAGVHCYLGSTLTPAPPLLMSTNCVSRYVPLGTKSLLISRYELPVTSTLHLWEPVQYLLTGYPDWKSILEFQIPISDVLKEGSKIVRRNHNPFWSSVQWDIASYMNTFLPSPPYTLHYSVCTLSASRPGTTAPPCPWWLTTSPMLNSCC